MRLGVSHLLRGLLSIVFLTEHRLVFLSLLISRFLNLSSLLFLGIFVAAGNICLCLLRSFGPFLSLLVIITVHTNFTSPLKGLFSSQATFFCKFLGINTRLLFFCSL